GDEGHRQDEAEPPYRLVHDVEDPHPPDLQGGAAVAQSRRQPQGYDAGGEGEAHPPPRDPGGGDDGGGANLQHRYRRGHGGGEEEGEEGDGKGGAVGHHLEGPGEGREGELRPRRRLEAVGEDDRKYHQPREDRHPEVGDGDDQ